MRKFIRCFDLSAKCNNETLLELIEENWKYSLEIHWTKWQVLVNNVGNKEAIIQFWEYWTRMYEKWTEWKKYEDWLKTNYKK